MIRPIVITGRAEHGKSTARQAITEFLNARLVSPSILNLPIAGAVKEVAKKYFGWDPTAPDAKTPYYLDEAKTKPDYSRGRFLLVGIGEKMKEVVPSVWMDYAVKRAKADAELRRGQGPSFWVIDDARFYVESKALEEFKQKLELHIVRPGHVAKEGPNELADDPSANAILITNDGSEEKLRKQVQAYAVHWLNRMEDKLYA